MEQTINLQQGTNICVRQVLANEKGVHFYNGKFIGIINIGNIIFVSLDYTIGDNVQKNLLIPLHTIVTIEYIKTDIVILKPRLQL